MKVRYTSLQADTGAAEEQAPSMAWPDLGRPAGRGLRAAQPGRRSWPRSSRRWSPARRVAYVMTDGAALPLALSDLVAELRARALLDVTITAGQAFGGELEAVATPSAIDLARARRRRGRGHRRHGTRRGRHRVDPRHDRAGGGADRRRDGRPRRAADRRRPHVRGRPPTSPPGPQPPHDRGVAPGGPGRRPSATRRARRCSPYRRRTTSRPSRCPPCGDVLARAGIEVRSMGRGPEDDPLFFATTAAAAVVAVRSHRLRGTVLP